MMTPGTMSMPSVAALSAWVDLSRRLAFLNRTIVSDDMEESADLVDQAIGFPAKRYLYPTGAEYGSWVVPPSWNVREAFLSDGERIIASYKDHVLFLAPYSAPFEGWISREELLKHVLTTEAFDDAFVYQHRLAYDFNKRLKEWQISLPQRIVSTLDLERYFVKIDVDVRPGSMNVLEYTARGEEETTVAFLAHLCHPGQANDGLSGVIAGIALIQRLLFRPHRFTYKLLIMPETIGSAIHVVAQGLSPKQIECAVFLETMGNGERLFLKRSRTGKRPIDLAVTSLVREHPEVGMHDFFQGYGNDEFVFDFPNVDIPSIGVQYYPFKEYHTSRDHPEIIDWEKWTRAVDLTEALFQRLEENQIIRLKHLGPPYLSRYRLYADAVSENSHFRKTMELLLLCDGQLSILEMCEKTGISFDAARDFFTSLDQVGLLA